MYKIIGGDQKEYGPATADEVRQWLAEGRANGQTLAQEEGSTEWKPLSAFPEFNAQLSASRFPPPVSQVPATVAGPGLSAEQILAGELDLDVASCLGRGWDLLRSNFGLLFGATLLIWALNFVAIFIPFASLLIHGVLFGGLYVLFLKRIRGQPAAISDAFSGFGTPFVHLLLAGLLSTLLAAIGCCFCILPGIYLQIAWIFCIPLVADKRLEFWSAMELSRKVVIQVWFKVFGLVIVVFLPFIVVALFVMVRNASVMFSIMQPVSGSSPPDFATLMPKLTQAMAASFPYTLLVQVAMLINLPFAVAALMYAYEDLFNPRTTPTT